MELKKSPMDLSLLVAGVQGHEREIVTGNEKREVVTDQEAETGNTERGAEKEKEVADTMMRENGREVIEGNEEIVKEIGKGRENIEVAIEIFLNVLSPGVCKYWRYLSRHCTVSSTLL